MPRQNPAATRKALSRAVLKADPDGAAQRKAVAVKHRRVVHYPESDGVSTVAATLPAEQAVHAMSVIDAHARASKAKDDPGQRRTLDQARADAFYHLVTGNTTSYPPAVVHVTVPLDTLLHLSDEPGELTGYGPIDPHTVRTLAAREDALWRRLLTEPATGLVVQAEPTRYRPTEAVRRLVSARDGHCTFPTCTMPATKTDLDHIIAFDHRQPHRGGLTVPENLHHSAGTTTGSSTRPDGMSSAARQAKPPGPHPADGNTARSPRGVGCPSTRDRYTATPSLPGAQRP